VISYDGHVALDLAQILGSLGSFEGSPIAQALQPGRLNGLDCLILDLVGLEESLLRPLGQGVAKIDMRNAPIIAVATPRQRAVMIEVWPQNRINFLARPLDHARIAGFVRNPSESHKEAGKRSSAAIVMAAPRPARAKTVDPATLNLEQLCRAAPEHRFAITHAHTALEAVFALGHGDSRLSGAALEAAGNTTVDSLRENGLSSWIEGVRQNHSSTYQHCLLVTGFAIAFGLHLGFRHTDLQRLAMGALLHDVGKALTPLAILDKPAQLDPDEERIMRKHPEDGFSLLRTKDDLHPEMLDLVYAHHEYLDGSGYPRGLLASSLSDLVRLITIADIAGALVERRSYKPALSPTEAFEVLQKMRGKLGMAIVKAIRLVLLGRDAVATALHRGSSHAAHAAA